MSATSGGPLPADLDAALAQVERAARDWGIRSDLMEGRFVSALMAAIRAAGEVNEGAKAEFREIARKGQEIARTEYQQARELAQATNTALAQARTAQVLAQTEKESLVARMIKETLPLFAENMRNVLVLREQRWNRDRLRRRYVLAGIVVLGIFLAGYGLRAWADKGDVDFAERCLSGPVATRGHVYCDMTALAAAVGQAGQ
jgi:multidrug efflux pump subunit AcrA (membrane-fusion protein)